MTIEDTSSIGSLVETVVATDADATSPNNRIQYALAGRGKASIYFHVEADTGAIRVRDDLRKETDSEYTVSFLMYYFFFEALEAIVQSVLNNSLERLVSSEVKLREYGWVLLLRTQ